MRWLLSLVVALSCVAHSQTADRRQSGFAIMDARTQAMQKDDAQNPAMLWVQSGAQLWAQPSSSNGKSCASCHGTTIAQPNSFARPPAAFEAVATRYPTIDALLGKPVNLSQRINLCRQRHMNMSALGSEHQDLLSLESWLGHAARGQAIAAQDPKLEVTRRQGEQLFMQRMGQLNLSCAQCHNERDGLKLGASTIPQGHATGYPIYRLEWQGMGSLARRIRGCLTGVRAQPFAAGSNEMTALEVYLAARAMGMPLETPAVRP
ncbi:sulfur oxidation c-type cytochrome SoxA [Variovorax sp. PCZ-1]|uniref:sulfur oxidation c-type cytochrome SoxA n=1 Tax=Variovorax sp. PCZ-1 TaxID=2835533 RepID=UPI001BCF192D|nr:sulfur oxidation c-type cytochrome SoxA [Variovorax sp. PCZ-1]MBS7807128.1 sulfur oxidation c-type cytochrome SoxA [Variovorax sp. PCZ-1]